jgi:hypothetical protein
MKMTWLLIAYGIGLFYFLIRQDHVADKDRFRMAWILFASIPLSHFVFTLLRVAFANPGKPTPRMARNMASVELWASGVEWLLLGISLIVLLTSIIPKGHPNSTTSS